MSDSLYRDLPRAPSQKDRVKNMMTIYNNNIEINDRNIMTMQHSFCVANASLKISDKMNGILDKNLSFIYGLNHDIGKFYLSKEEMYMHPRYGYNLFKKDDIDIANICVSHPFPSKDNFDYIMFYCHNDKNEATEIYNILKDVDYNNDYVRLLQLCDKISGLDSYMTIDEKFEWYRRKSPVEIPACVLENHRILNDIKKYFDETTHTDIYSMLL